MKRIIILAVLSFTLHLTYGQACGMYAIKYVGEIKSNLTIEKIKLPSVSYLHNLEVSFIAYKPIANKINIESFSPLTSHLYRNGEKLLNFYKIMNENLSIIFVVKENGQEREILKTISWNEISIVKIQDDSILSSFEIRLNAIQL